MQKSTLIYCIILYLFGFVILGFCGFIQLTKSKNPTKLSKFYSTLDTIMAIYNTPIDIYHCFEFNLTYRSCEVLSCRISKRYSKRYFIYVCQPTHCKGRRPSAELAFTNVMFIFDCAIVFVDYFYMFYNIKKSACIIVM